MASAIFDVSRKDDVSTFYVRGYIDESVTLPEFIKDTTQLVVIDCEHLKGMNSAGINRWVPWIKNLAEQVPVRLQYCQRSFINAVGIVINMVPENAEIKSLYVPYYCGSCEKESYLFFETVQLHYDVVSRAPFEVPEVTECKGCGEEAKIDVVPHIYFAFLKDA
jgi:hypothetical protein